MMSRVQKIKNSQHTLGAFLEPALPCGKGAGAAFLAFGAYHQHTLLYDPKRLSLREGVFRACLRAPLHFISKEQASRNEALLVQAIVRIYIRQASHFCAPDPGRLEI